MEARSSFIRGPSGALDIASSRGMARRHDYVTWLDTVASAIAPVRTLQFRKAIDERFLFGSWIAAIVLALLCTFALDIAVMAGIGEMLIALVVMVRGMPPGSDMLA